jgi:phosphoglycolate phosphatase-like HAD superfamily hydrolase
MSEEPVTVCVDLDGVLNLYDGWRGASYFHPPRPGAEEFLRALSEQGYRVVVFTVRWREHVEEWLVRHGLRDLVAEVTDKKPAAHVYLDDHAICFQGDFDRALQQIREFKPHWESR